MINEDKKLEELKYICKLKIANENAIINKKIAEIEEVFKELYSILNIEYKEFEKIIEII